MSAFIIVFAKLTDREKFSAYARAVPPLIKKFGGCYRVLGDKPELLEGNFLDGNREAHQLVISEWPDRDTAIRFWNSEEYREAAKLRENCGEFTVMLTNALPINSIN